MPLALFLRAFEKRFENDCDLSRFNGFVKNQDWFLFHRREVAEWMLGIPEIFLQIKWLRRRKGFFPVPADFCSGQTFSRSLIIFASYRICALIYKIVREYYRPYVRII